ncbi:hypothetical protein HQ584_00890 [Patescibacteria group bacterium]|nr:hypothetical protein [Patescibacteria group bacterium]
MDDSTFKIIIPELPGKLKKLSEEEERIKKNSVMLLKSNANLDKMLGAYEKAMDMVFSLVTEYKIANDSELTIQYIGIRFFNALAVSLRLMLCGYYQISFAIQRDIIEMYFLLDYFLYCPAKIIEWKDASNGERIKNYSPRIIRDILDKRDGCVSKRRGEKYKMFCEYAAHVSYSGNKLVAPKGFGMIGPFFDEKYLKNCFTELSDNGFYAVLLFMDYFENVGDKNISRIKLEFLKQLADWYRERFKEEPKIDPSKIDELITLLL